MSQLLSTAVITATGLTCKAFLNSGLCSITISNLSVLLDALQCETRRHRGQGVVTVSNHLSTLDDPVVWGALPARFYLSPHTNRWVLGASDIIFTNLVFSAFFHQGQVIETFRGKGVFQPALDTAIDKLNNGHWVHLFSEGAVRQPASYPQINGVTHLPRFKWGIGRILMDTDILPVIIPMWLTGFDKLMPEGRRFPYKFFPKLGVRLGVAFGNPIPPEKITALLNDPWHDRSIRTSKPYNSPARGDRGLHNPALVGEEFSMREKKMDSIRSEVTVAIQRAVEDLGRRMSGDKLDGPLTLPHVNR
ncbi:hypothetical protein ID866_1186 [Astraeus odoratus]|nr:hypothetical protein ID866_1186 [Astraeus odoratus]